jgi:dihydrolipoamide dehydrogenase
MYAAIHAGLKTAVFSGQDVGGTCVNRGCVPSKALLAAAGRIRDMQDEHHLSGLGITVEGGVTFDRQAVADHAKNLASRVKGNLEASLKGLGADVIDAKGEMVKAHTVKGGGKEYTAKDIILAPGSLPFVPPGVQVRTVYVHTSAFRCRGLWWCAHQLPGGVLRCLTRAACAAVVAVHCAAT